LFIFAYFVKTESKIKTFELLSVGNYNDAQRTGLCDVGELEKRLHGTVAD
jgi:hypothetical protein